MLDVSLPELTGRANQQMLAQKAWLGVDERHPVLQLVAKAKGPTRLVGSAPPPQTACQSLIQEPAVGQHVERRIRRFHVYGAEGVLPVFPDRFQFGARGARAAEA